MSGDVQDVEIPATDTGWFWSGLVAAPAIAIGLAIWQAPTSNEGLTATAALALISGVAVSSERAIETFWSFIDRNGRMGGWWPLTMVSARILAIEGPTNRLIQEPLAGIQQALLTTRAGLNNANKLAQRIDAQLAVLTREIDRGAPGRSPSA